MNFSIYLIALILFTQNSQSSTLYSCIHEAFQSTCKTQIYACTNNPECSYQLHQNTQHIFLTQKSEEFPTLYLSNPIARTLYVCLKNKCQLPEIDENYPKTLPLDSCLIQVYDICRGDIEKVFSDQSSTSSEAICYRKYCRFPSLSSF